jgi:hypothetical protein
VPSVPNTGVYRRLHGLLRRGLLQRMGLPGSVNHGPTTLRHCYFITAQGRERADLAAPHQADVEVHCWDRIAVNVLAHTALIGRCYAALACELAFRQVAWHDWQIDAQLRRAPFVVRVPGMQYQQHLVPDATFRMGTTRCFVEVDRGTEGLAQWERKLATYTALARTPPLAAPPGVTLAAGQPVQVLVVAPDEGRLQRLAAVARSYVQRVHYRFLTEDLLHPLTIRKGWRALAGSEAALSSSDPRPQSLVLVDAPLWEPVRRTEEGHA